MNFLITFFIFAGCLLALATGLLLSKRSLRKNCSDDPSACACLNEGKDPKKCDD